MSFLQANAAAAQAVRVQNAQPVDVTPSAQREPAESPVQKVLATAPQGIRSEERAPPPMVDPARLRERLERVVEDLNSMIQSGNRDLAFGVDHVASRFVVTVKNANNGDVIRQIPGEDVLRIAHRMEALKGMLFEDLF